MKTHSSTFYVARSPNEHATMIWMKLLNSKIVVNKTERLEVSASRYLLVTGQ
jgi:hypothetical protein